MYVVPRDDDASLQTLNILHYDVIKDRINVIDILKQHWKSIFYSNFHLFDKIRIIEREYLQVCLFFPFLDPL